MFDPDVTTPLLWTKDHISDADLMYFRGDNAYAWQTRSMKMNILSKTSVIPVFDIEQVLRNQQIDLAINIHSFSECKLTAIEWWLSKIAQAGIQHLMIVPNAPVLTTREGINFSPIIDKYGYKLIANDPKYSDPVLQGYGINPSYYYLFSLS